MDTFQEKNWAGDFGNKYTERNALTPEGVANSLYLFCKIAESMTSKPKRILEMGTNIGINIHALS